MRHFVAGIVLLAFASLLLCPVQGSETSPLAALKFLEGKWVGEGSSEVGKGGGYATFEADLQGKVLVRRNHAEYPTGEGRPAYLHDDLMIIYPDASTKGIRAFYTDNEGHVIHYAVSASADGSTITFLGDVEGDAPRYRLSYTRTAADKMTILLEAGKGQDPATFHKIVEGKLVKLGAAKP
jgi:hypothetical protein